MAAIYLLPALGADWLALTLSSLRFTPHVPRPTAHTLRSTLYVLLAALLAWIGVTTGSDYFNTWAFAPEVRDLRFARLAQLSRDLDRSPETSPVVVAGVYIEDIEPLVPVALMRRRDISFRWHDAATTQVVPAGVSLARYFEPGASLRTANADALRQEMLARTSATPDVWLAPPGDALLVAPGTPAVRPISFEGRVELLGMQVSPQHVVTFWRVLRDGSPSSTAMFVHLVTPDREIVAQDDRLGFPTHSWRAGDVFSQTFTLDVPASFTGQAWLEIGLYDRVTSQRWQVSGAPGVNRVLTQWPGASSK